VPLLNETVKRFAQAHPKTVRVPPPRYRSFPAVRAGLYRITGAHQPTLQDPGRDAAVTAHRVVAAWPEVILHARAGLALPRAFEHSLADAKTAVLERREADAGDDQVTAQQRGIDGVESRQRGDGAEMFLLNEGDLALAAAACGAVIPCDAGVGDQLYRINDPNRRARRRAQPDPHHTAAARKAGAQIGEGGVVIEHVRLTALRFI
jgi:hypothetical protein